ncbi:MAG: histidine kinase dimerization/phospho-acceptor domain-containing protein [bacterium]
MHRRILEAKSQNKYSSHRRRDIEEKLLSDVVHKIKNNLGGIGGFAALLDRDLEPNDARKRLVRRIQDGVVRMNEVVVSLMTLVREHEPCYKKVQLRSLVKDAWENYWGRDEQGMLPNLPQFNGKIELSADPQLIAQMVFHAIRFIDLMGGQIESIEWVEKPRNRVSVEYGFLNGSLSSKEDESISRLMYDCEPLEARLSLAIVLRMAKLHSGSVSIVTRSGNLKVLKVQLMKGC